MAQTMANQFTALLGMIRTGKVNMYTAFSKLVTILTEGLITRQATIIMQQRWTAPSTAATGDAATQYDLNTKAQADCPIAVAGESAPDFPRNIKVTGTQLTGATVVSGTITGKDQFGVEQTETFSVTTAAKTATGSIAFSGVPVIVITTITGTGGAGDLIDFGYDLKFGLNGDVFSESDAVIKLNLDDADSGIADSTIDATNNTIIFETAPNNTRNFEIWFKAGTSNNTFDI
jgi:hypothetical protein